MTAGFLYILTNPSMPGLVKVGKTVRDPRTRVRELSGATGVPTPFELAHVEAFDDCHAAERRVHAALAAAGIRISSKREFFAATPETVQQVFAAHRRTELARRRTDSLSPLVSRTLYTVAAVLCAAVSALLLYFTPFDSGGTVVAAVLAWACLEVVCGLPPRQVRLPPPK